MKIFTEKEAEEFLEKEGFDVVDRISVKKETDLKKAIRKINFPLVMKISGKKIIHKNKVRGVKVGIKNYKQAINAFKKLKKIKDFEGVMIQKQIKGKEFLLGVKKTPEFEHVIAFGAGGIYTEKLKDISFRVCPFDESEAREMIKEVKIARNLKKRNITLIEKDLIKLCRLIKKYPNITELDINPLIVNKKAVIVDARIVFD